MTLASVYVTFIFIVDNIHGYHNTKRRIGSVLKLSTLSPSTKLPRQLIIHSSQIKTGSYVWAYTNTIRPTYYQPKWHFLWARFVFLNIQSRPEGRQVTTWDFVPSGSLLGVEDEIVTGRLLFRVQTGEIDFALRLRDYGPIHTEYDTNTNTNTKLKQKLSIRVSATEIQQQLK
ncbi:hypothetical protein YC2023_094550 [Brassica napus]